MLLSNFNFDVSLLLLLKFYYRSASGFRSDFIELNIDVLKQTRKRRLLLSTGYEVRYAY